MMSDEDKRAQTYVITRLCHEPFSSWRDLGERIGIELSDYHKQSSPESATSSITNAFLKIYCGARAAEIENFQSPTKAIQEIMWILTSCGEHIIDLYDAVSSLKDSYKCSNDDEQNSEDADCPPHHSAGFLIQPDEEDEREKQSDDEPRQVFDIKDPEVTSALYSIIEEVSQRLRMIEKETAGRRMIEIETQNKTRLLYYPKTSTALQIIQEMIEDLPKELTQQIETLIEQPSIPEKNRSLWLSRQLGNNNIN